MAKEIRTRRLLNYIRAHRQKAGLTQHELDEALGYEVGAVSQHERLEVIPPLRVAIGYEIIFRVPTSEIFAGLREELVEEIETRLATIEERLGRRDVNDGNAEATARKLMWLSQRRDAGHES